MQRKFNFSLGEHYHVYNRGVDKRKVFLSRTDHQRFLLLLLLGNSQKPISIRDVIQKHSTRGESLGDVFEKIHLNCELETRCVEILAYCLMPNHFHLILRECAEGGISRFMSKILTGYSMYFNKKYERVGTLFERPFKAQHIDTDPYFRHIFAYVHLNPVNLYQKDWKEKGLQSKKKAVDFLRKYQYSSFQDYFGKERPERNILTLDDDTPWMEDFKRPESLFDFYEYEG